MMRSKTARSKCGKRARDRRRGAAMIECAVCLPILSVFVLATIESCSMFYTTQSLEIAAYEAARTALVPGAQNANVQAQAELILEARRVKDYTVTVSPSDIQTAAPGDPINVTVSASADANNFIRPWFFAGKSLVGDAEMMKEF